MDKNTAMDVPRFPRPTLGDGTEPTTVLLKTHDEPALHVPLFRFEGTGQPVLLLHGASAWSGSFVVPKNESLVDALRSRGHDVWLLDWRGGRNTLQRYDDPRYGDLFSFESIAKDDVLNAVRHIAETRGRQGRSEAVNMIGHCVGGGLAALAVALRDEDTHPLRKVVLSTLGLFAVQDWQGALKADDLLLERALAAEPERTTVHPDPVRVGEPWPGPLEAGWRIWPKPLLPGHVACGDGDSRPGPVFSRLAFMFGRIAMWNRLHPSLRGDTALCEQFGRIHLQTYLQCGQSVRRGFIAPFDAPVRTAVDRSDDLLRRRFLNKEKFSQVPMTLITGVENNLWHRDSIDKMSDWLRRIPGQVGCVKHVVPGYGHQDLLWGTGAGQRAVMALYLDGVA